MAKLRWIMQMPRYDKWLRVSIVLVVAISLSNCSSQPIRDSETHTSQPVPTVAALFTDQRPTALPMNTSTDLDQSTPSSNTPNSSTGMSTRQISIYNDTLDLNWSLEHSVGVHYNLASTSYVDQGNKALAVTPSGDEGKLVFTVNESSREVYKRDRVLGISFRLSGGANYINNDALLVVLQGSNRYPYWVLNDTSVQVKGRVTDKEAVFSETRLYYLDINKAVPPDTWVDVVVWLDELIYDPEYTYVTGFQIKNEKSFQDTFYIDQVNLIVEK